MSGARLHAAAGAPVLVELLGRAGAGKSTIHRTLLERYGDIEPMPLLRKRPYTGVLARHTLAALGTLARRRALDPRFPVDQLRMMAYLRGLPEVFAAGGRHRVVLFDQGPLFSLTRPYLADARLAGWWESTFALWRERLDLVVSLDAPDDVLLERIRARPKFHRVQDREKQDALAFLANTRSVYEDALARLVDHERAPIVLRIDTGRSSVDAAAERIRSCIDEVLTAGGGRGTHGRRLPVASV